MAEIGLPYVQLVTALAQLGAGGCVLAALLILRPLFSQAITALSDSNEIYRQTAGSVDRLEVAVNELPGNLRAELVVLPCIRDNDG